MNSPKNPPLPDFTAYASYELSNYRFFFDLDDGQVLSSSPSWSFSGLSSSGISKHDVRRWLSRYKVSSIDDILFNYWYRVYASIHATIMPMLVYDSIDDDTIFMNRLTSDTDDIDGINHRLVVINSDDRFWCFVHCKDVKMTWFMCVLEYPERKSEELDKHWKNIPTFESLKKVKVSPPLMKDPLPKSMRKMPDELYQPDDLTLASPIVIEAFTIFNRFNKSLPKSKRLITWDKQIVWLPVKKIGRWCVHAIILKVAMESKSGGVGIGKGKRRVLIDDYEGLPEWLVFKLNLVEKNKVEPEKKVQNTEVKDFATDPVAQVLKKRMSDWDIRQNLWNAYITDKERYKEIYFAIEKKIIEGTGMNYSSIDFGKRGSTKGSNYSKISTINSPKSTLNLNSQDSLTYFMNSTTKTTTLSTLKFPHSSSATKTSPAIYQQQSNLSYETALFHYFKPSLTTAINRKDNHTVNNHVTNRHDFDASVSHMMINHTYYALKDRCNDILYEAGFKRACLKTEVMMDMQRANGFVPQNVGVLLTGERNLMEQCEVVMLPVIELIPPERVATVLAEKKIEDIREELVEHCGVFLIYPRSKLVAIQAPQLSKKLTLEMAARYQKYLMLLIDFGLKTIVDERPSSSFRVSILEPKVKNSQQSSHDTILNLICSVLSGDSPFT